MNQWKHFKSFKQRGEWVELQFMAQAAAHGFSVLKPWGDSLQYDFGVEQRGHLLRVQVKGSSARKGRGGYLCRLRRGGQGEQYYKLFTIGNGQLLFFKVIHPVTRAPGFSCVSVRNTSFCMLRVRGTNFLNRHSHEAKLPSPVMINGS